MGPIPSISPGWRRDARHGVSRRLAAIPARVTDGSGRLGIWRAISVQMVGNLISRQGSRPVSCRTGRSMCGTRMAWSDGQPTSEFAEMRTSLGCIVQPVAQSPIKALAPEDLGMLGSRNPRHGVESILAPFMQQAELFIGRHKEIGLFRRRC